MELFLSFFLMNKKSKGNEKRKCLISLGKVEEIFGRGDTVVQDEFQKKNLLLGFDTKKRE